jgi:methionyl-tRNA formyltransferase
MPLDRPLRVIFLGTPAFAVPSLEGIVRSGAELVAVVCQPDRPQGRGLGTTPPPVKEWALARGLPVHQPEKVRNGLLRSLLEPYAPDLLVVTAYGRILPREVLELPPLGCVNGHASLLPKLRGAAPIQWAIATGETETGVTLMQMDEGLDTGDMLVSRSIPIGPEETAPELHDRLAALTGELLAEALPRLARRELARVPQDHACHTLAPLLKKEDGFLDLRRPAKELADRTRGFQPWPGAVLFQAGRPVKVHRARPAPATGAAPGTVVRAGEVLAVETGDGVLEVLELQPEGRRRVTAREFVSGTRMAAGDRFDVPPPTRSGS